MCGTREQKGDPKTLLNRKWTENVLDKYLLDAIIATAPENIAYLGDFRALTNQYLRSAAFFPETASRR